MTTRLRSVRAFLTTAPDRGTVVIPAQRVAWTGDTTPVRPPPRAALLGAVAVVAVAQLVVAIVGRPVETARQAPARADACGPAWSTAWQAPAQRVPAPKGLRGATLRVVVTPQVAGSQVRVRLSDDGGSAPLVVGSSTVAWAGTGAALVPGTVTPLRFGGRPGVTIPPGVDVLSDPVALDVDAGAPLTVSAFVTAAPPVVTGHARSQQPSWLAEGDAAGASDGTGFRTSLPSSFLLSGLDVLAARPVDAVVAVGDSITDGVGSVPGTRERWTDVLAERLAAAGGSAPMTVLNSGIPRNQLLADDPAGGVAPMARFGGDVGEAAGATDVVLHVGTNDIAQGRSAVAIEAGLAAYADRARAAGKRVFLTTITPATNGVHATPAAAATRNTVDAWLLTRGRAHADGVFDFAAAVADPADPDRLAPAFDSGDGLHLSAAGNRALAAAVDAGALSGSPCLVRGSSPGVGVPAVAAGRQWP